MGSFTYDTNDDSLTEADIEREFDRRYASMN